MTPSKQVQTPPSGSTVALLASADALLRAALEACRQHERVSRLLEKHCADDELRDAAMLCELSAAHLTGRLKEYEAAASEGRGACDETLWHVANTLWHASREYQRRAQSGDAAALHLSRHNPERMGELHLEFEFAASAVLAVRQAIAAYRKLRTDAE
ncbi:MAG: hypothetical protein NTZ43_12600 [Gemmatimonadetes bacterium]|nr:hypothetical protein [Gemmatimonadota bacterium]